MPKKDTKENVLVITNFAGRLTRYVNGDINSGFAKFNTSHSYDPFSKPGNLTWMEQPTSILSSTTQGIVAAKERFENNINYVYAIGTGSTSTGDTPTLFKIQVNNTGTKNPNYDNPSIIGGVTSESGSVVTALYGPSLQFYGTTENIFLGSDQRITKLNFNGSVIAAVSNISSMVTNVPRPSAQFLGKMYWGNGNNLIEIDSTETITSYAKLSPGFPTGTYIRDLDVTPDGNYLQITVSRNNSPTQVQFNPDFSTTSSSEAYKFLWNGTDNTYTAYENYPGYSLTSNTVFGQSNFTLGTDLNGTALYKGSNKILTLPQVSSPNFSAAFSTGNLLGFSSPEYNSSVIGSNSGSVVGLQTSTFFYGQYDEQTPPGLFRVFKQSASVASGDDEVIRVPISLPISNLTYTYTGAGYTNNIVGSSKLYFSTTEREAGDVAYKLYKFFTVPTGTASVIGGVYETQTQLLSEKVDLSTVYIYAEPWVAGNQFKVELIGSDGNAIPNSDYTFGVGLASGTRQGNITAGNDYAWYSPNCKPTYAIGLRITNQGSTNFTIHKVEIRYGVGGH